jgi:hypothetical protein
MTSGAMRLRSASRTALASASPDATRRLFLGVLAASAFPGCAVQRALTAGLYSTDDFAPLPEEPRVRAEPGAEAFARRVAPYVVSCVTRVETGHYRRFAQPVAIYVCATAHSFSVHSGASTAPKGAVNERLFLNRLFETPERIPRIPRTSSRTCISCSIRIRLSRSSPHGSRARPLVATAVARKRECREAREALRVGLRIDPTVPKACSAAKADYTATRSPTRRNASTCSIAKTLFMGYLRTTDEARFRQFLLRVQDGGDFAESVRAAYARNLDELWQQFLSELSPA